MVDIRRLNEAGIDAFRDYLRDLKNDPTLAPPRKLLDDPSASLPVLGNATVEQREFSSKYAFGSYIVDRVQRRIADRELRSASGMGIWVWLTLFYIDAVCPVSASGRRKVLAQLEKYIPSAAHIATGLDKHLLFFPWKMVAIHK